MAASEGLYRRFTGYAGHGEGLTAVRERCGEVFQLDSDAWVLVPTVAVVDLDDDVVLDGCPEACVVLEAH